MRLLAGRFVTSEQNYPLIALRDNIVKQNFSGHCIIHKDSDIITLVFIGGTVILAEFPPHRGADALRRIRALVNQRAYVEFYSHTEIQTATVWKFNQICRIDLKGAETATGSDPTPETGNAGSTGISRQDARKLTIDDQFAKEIQTLESMDLEAMKRRFKEDFKEVITDLDLDHLIRKSKDNMKSS